MTRYEKPEPLTQEEERSMRGAGAAWVTEYGLARLFITLDNERLARKMADLAMPSECRSCASLCAECGCRRDAHSACDAVFECGQCGQRACGGDFTAPQEDVRSMAVPHA